eukprot:1102918_1
MSLSPFTSPGHTSHVQQVRMPMPPTTERNKWINDIKCKPTNEDIQSANIGNTEQTDAETTDTYNNLIQMQTYERRHPNANLRTKTTNSPSSAAAFISKHNISDDDQNERKMNANNQPPFDVR